MLISPPWAAFLAGAATVSAALALVVLEVSPTGLSSLSNAVSQWALTPYIWGYRWFVLSLAAAGVALAVSIAATHRKKSSGVVISLGLFAFGRSFVGWVNMDAPGAVATVRGDVHWVLGFISFISGIVAMFLTARLLRAGRRRSALSVFCLVIGWIALASLVLFLVAGAVSGDLGLFERCFYVSVLVWMATMVVAILRGALLADSTAPTGRLPT